MLPEAPIAGGASDVGLALLAIAVVELPGVELETGSFAPHQQRSSGAQEHLGLAVRKRLDSPTQPAIQR